MCGSLTFFFFASELADMKEVRTYNSQLLRNILPDHVAMHFLLAEERRLDVSTGRRDPSFTLVFVPAVVLKSQILKSRLVTIKIHQTPN